MVNLIFSVPQKLVITVRGHTHYLIYCMSFETRMSLSEGEEGEPVPILKKFLRDLANCHHQIVRLQINLVQTSLSRFVYLG